MYDLLGIHAPADSLFGMSLPLLLAVVLGGLVGLEREIHGHPAGLRTHILVCVGSTLITLVSIHIADGGGAKGDPARLAAQIVSGIGFLGAGAILREGLTVRGLTTAASVWTTAGIGIALGANPFLGQLAVVATVLVLVTLWLLNYFEDFILVRTRRPMVLHVIVRDTNRAAANVLARIAGHDVRIVSVTFEHGVHPHTREIVMRVAPPDRFDRVALLAELAEQEEVQHVDFPR